MKAAEIKLEKFDNSDVIATSTPTFANKFTLSGIDGYSTFSITGEYGSEKFEKTYRGAYVSDLCNFLGFSGSDADLVFRISEENFTDLEHISSEEERDIYEPSSYAEYNDIEFMWNAIEQIFVLKQ